MDTKQNKQVDHDINRAAIGFANMVYDDSLKALNATLKQFGVNPRSYTVLGVRDESSCLTYQDGEWVTFYYERGQQTGESHFTDINDACIELLRSVGYGNSHQLMREYFQEELGKRRKQTLSSHEFEAFLRKGLSYVAML